MSECNDRGLQLIQNRTPVLSDRDAVLQIHSLETFGTSDGPGIRLVVFIQGCPFRCVFCHNPDSQALHSSGAKELPLAELLERLEKQRPYFRGKGGVTFSGGEPTMQANTLLTYLPAIRRAGFHVALDTCGAIYTPAVNQVYDLSDLVILDVKHIDPAWHRKVTGRPIGNVLKNAAYREQSGKPLWLRYVLVPGYTDQPEFLEQWGQTFTGYHSVERVELLPYHTLGVHKYAELGRVYPLAGAQRPNAGKVNTAEAIFRKYFANVVVH
jgi:pyruvate formate lyase activating enzyme